MPLATLYHKPTLRMETPQSKRLSIRPEWRDNRLSFVASVKPSPGTPDSAKLTMEQSPLTQQARPEVFEPKVVGLYKALFRVCSVWSTVEPVLTASRKSKTTRKVKGFGANYFY